MGCMCAWYQEMNSPQSLCYEKSVLLSRRAFATVAVTKCCYAQHKCGKVWQTFSVWKDWCHILMQVYFMLEAAGALSSCFVSHPGWINYVICYTKTISHETCHSLEMQWVINTWEFLSNEVLNIISEPFS